VEAEDLVVNEGGKREIIEQIGKELPNIGIAVFSETFVVEAINLGDLARLMIASEDRNSGWVSYLEGNEKGNGFYRVVTPINVIACMQWSVCFKGNGKTVYTHEEVVGIRIWSTDSEEFHQVVKLPMNVSAYGYGAFLLIALKLKFHERRIG